MPSESLLMHICQPNVNILVNCAGVTQQSLLLQVGTKSAENILQTNLASAIWGCKFIGKKMIKAKEGGCIINISSLLANKAVAGTSVYAASKAGLLGKFYHRVQQENWFRHCLTYRRFNHFACWRVRPIRNSSKCYCAWVYRYVHARWCVLFPAVHFVALCPLPLTFFPVPACPDMAGAGTT
jgi:hypothetical protein